MNKTEFTHFSLAVGESSHYLGSGSNPQIYKTMRTVSRPSGSLSLDSSSMLWGTAGCIQHAPELGVGSSRRPPGGGQ